MPTVPRTVAGGVLAVAICAGLLLAAAARAEEGGAPPSSSQAAFDELYARITAAVAGSELPAAVATSAEEIRFELTTELIRRDAEIEVLKLEAGRFAGDRQAAALDGLVRAATARERRVWTSIRRLERLTGTAAAAPVEAEPPPADSEEVDSDDRGSFRITFEAQNVVEDPDP